MQSSGVGTTLHGHRLVEKIGEGHYGTVWRADYMGHPVALKVFNTARRPSHVRRETFAQYALGRLPGGDARFFPRVEHIDLDADPPYVRMELLEGTPLEVFLDNPALALEARLSIGERILEALAAVHRNGFLHGDLSPRNVLVNPDGNVRLIDVGYGALFEDTGDIALSTTEEDRPAGVASPLYSAPERFAGNCGKPADVFSFGKVLYRLITGEQPFVVKPVSRKFRALGRTWDEFVFRCLEESPGERYPDAEEALADYLRINRPALAAGEYRAECPECRAAQSIPGGWAGERFNCRGCNRRLEVLFYDNASRYATTVLVGSLPEPPIVFLEAQRDPEARFFCPACAREIRPPAKKCQHCGVRVDERAREISRQEARRRSPAPPRSFHAAALLTFLSYFLLWLPGVILNWFFLEDARRVADRAGQDPPGMLFLRAMMWIFVYIPVLIAIGLGALFLLFAVFLR